MIEVLLIALALSADVFAISIGMSVQIQRIKTALYLTAYFALFHALMPALGYFVGLGVLKWIEQYAHWFGFILLVLVGCKMIYDSIIEIYGNKQKGGPEDLPLKSFGHFEILTLSVVTSIDALAVGSTLAILELHPVISCIIIGTTTGLVSLFGLSIGRKSSNLFKDKAGIFGGCILIFIGFRILLT